jgi:hypothetical protein
VVSSRESGGWKGRGSFGLGFSGNQRDSRVLIPQVESDQGGTGEEDKKREKKESR